MAPDSTANFMHYSIVHLNVTTENRVEQLETRNKELLKRLDDLDSAGFVKCCRVCFKETERSVGQCQYANDTCSGWSCSSKAGWTLPFRDNTDYRPGGCTYQWRVECKDKM